MINIIKGKAAAWMLALVVCSVFIACNDIMPEGGNGTIAVTIDGNSARKIVPWADTLDSKDLVFTIEISNAEGDSQTKTIPAGGGTAQFTVIPGPWTITAEARYSGELVALGGREIEVRPGNNGSVTLLMQKPANFPSFTVSFNSGGGSRVPDQTVGKYGKVSQPAPPTFEDKFFDGWYKEAAGLTQYDFNSPVTSGFTLFAKWVAVDVHEGWSKFVDGPPNTATIDFTVDSTGVCAVTVGGTAMPPLNDQGGTTGNTKYWNSIWRASVGYDYTIVAGRVYTYKFEAWTEGTADRLLNVQWYWDEDNTEQNTGYVAENDDWENSVCPPAFKITPTRTTYTLTSKGPLPKSGPFAISFQCANQLGKFYVKMISITSEEAGSNLTPLTFEAYLATLPDNAAATPYDVRMEISQYNDGQWWECWVIRDALHKYPNKFVMLDLFSGNVPVIEGGAFEDCVNLTGIILPDSITRIGGWAFGGCNKLASVTLGSNVTSIEDGAFADCASLASINLPSGLTSIAASTFGGCGKLASVTIPDSVISIENWAFSNCASLASLTIGSGVKSIGTNAFENCGMTSVVIPNGVTSIGEGAFFECSKLASLTIGSGVTSIGKWAFEKCGITSVIIPNSVTSIGEKAFTDCANLSSLTIGSGVRSIENYAFERTGITSLAIPNSVTSIGEKAFADCSKLASLTLGSGVTSIGNWAFEKTGITSLAIPNSVTSFGDGVFGNCASLASAVIGNGVTRLIGSFHDCVNLASVSIGSGVTVIEFSAFEGCKITSVIIPNSVTRIGDWAFNSCKSLASVTIGSGVTSLGRGAFTYCESLTSVTIPASVKSLGQYALGSCINLVSVTFQGTIPSSQFHNEATNFGNLREVFYASNVSEGTPGTYTTQNSGGYGSNWEKQ